MSLAALQEAAGAVFTGEAGASLPLRFGEPAAELAAARTGPALFDLSHRGRLRMTGADRLAYLHRVTAQSFRDLLPPAGALAAILERTGKIVDVVTAHLLQDHLLILTSAANREAVAAWLSRFIFRDDVQIRDETGSTGQLLVAGPGASRVARALAGDGAASLPPHASAPIGRPEATLIRAVEPPGEAFWLIAPEAGMPSLWEAARSAGARPAGLATFEALRILGGAPAGGLEIDAEANPLELGLEGSVSLTKGCFTGQEALAKMITHKAVRRRLVGLRVLGEDLPEPGAQLRLGEEVVGRVTSRARIPGSGERLGLGLCRREQAEPGTRLVCGGAGVEIAPLPFAGPAEAAG